MNPKPIWVLEIKVAGTWMPTEFCALSRAHGRTMARELNADDPDNGYRIAPYARTEGKG